MKIKATVKSFDQCAPLSLEKEEIWGLATLGDGEQIPAILHRDSGFVEYKTPKGKPLGIVRFFDYDPPEL